MAKVFVTSQVDLTPQRITTGAANNWVDVENLMVKPDGANMDVLVLMMCDWACGATSNNAQLRGIYDTQGSDTSLHDTGGMIFSPEATTEWRPWMTMKKLTLTADQAYNFRLQASASSTSFVSTRNARIIVFELTADDQYDEINAETSTTSTGENDVTGLSITFTPGSTGDYLVLWCGEMNNSSTTVKGNVFLDIDGTNHATPEVESDATAQWYWVGGIKMINLSNASHTIKLQYGNASGAGTLKIRNARIFVLRLSA